MKNIWLKRIDSRRDVGMQSALMDDLLLAYAIKRSSSFDSVSSDPKTQQKTDPLTNFACQAEDLGVRTGPEWQKLSVKDIIALNKAFFAKKEAGDSAAQVAYCVDERTHLVTTNRVDSVAKTFVALPPPLSPPICPMHFSHGGVPDTTAAYTVSPSLSNDSGYSITVHAAKQETDRSCSSIGYNNSVLAVLQATLQDTIKARHGRSSAVDDLGEYKLLA